MLLGNSRRMRTLRFSMAVVFRYCVAWSCLSTLLLCGCAVLFGDERSLVATLPAQTSSPAKIKAVLKMSTQYIEFDGFQGQTGDQRLHINVINRGRSAFEMKHADGKYGAIPPESCVEIFNDKIAGSTNSLRLRVSGIERRTPCEFRLDVSSPSQFVGAIRVYVFNSSAPL